MGRGPLILGQDYEAANGSLEEGNLLSTGAAKKGEIGTKLLTGFEEEVFRSQPLGSNTK